jgi:glycosyltransferase involved in cell wall biosynthesis
VDQVMRVFLREFDGNPKARLQVKCFPDCQVDTLRHAQVEFIREFLSGPSLADWYSRLHCFVSSSAGEGWGLMLQEAMATGRPVITPMFGGVSAFAERGACVVVPHEEVPVPDGDEYYAGKRAVVSDEALAAGMRQIYSDWQSGSLRHRGWLAALQAGRFPWMACPLGVLDVLTRHGFMLTRPAVS